jgi:hypothetical protein
VYLVELDGGRVEATLIEKMPGHMAHRDAVIRAEEGRTRARLNRLVRERKIERKRDQGNGGEVYLFRKLS